eukprot:Seg4160.1 transcript_id=Seg4160.1/GoldUCD/mRNA.D3Y31 product="Alstrom syndrome protein 1" protein_id=Seg4160.1/GoldUCD/D3Y31
MSGGTTSGDNDKDTEKEAWFSVEFEDNGTNNAYPQEEATKLTAEQFKRNDDNDMAELSISHHSKRSVASLKSGTNTNADIDQNANGENAAGINRQDVLAEEYTGQWFALEELKSSLRQTQETSSVNDEMDRNTRETEKTGTAQISLGSNADIVVFKEDQLHRDEARAALTKHMKQSYPHQVEAHDNVDTDAQHISDSRISLKREDSERRRLSLDDGGIASMERPEPLGKARIDSDTKTTRKKGFRGDIIEAWQRAPSASVELAGGDQIETTSNEELREQEYPIRVPLSVAEGLNGYTTVKQHFGGRDIEGIGIRETGRNMPMMYSEETHGEVLGSEALRESITAQMDIGLNEGNAFDRNLTHRHDMEKEMSNLELMRGSGQAEDANTPVSKLLGPTYRSSVALLEELKKRRLRHSSKETSNNRIDSKAKKKTDFKDIGIDRFSDEGDRFETHNEINPFELAENAMKASNILSNRTEKSLKRASLVLKAVEEHRSPPTDLSDSFSYSAAKIQHDIKDRMRELSALSIDSSDSSRVLSSDSQRGDNIENLIDSRLKALDLYSSSSVTSQSKSSASSQSSQIDSTVEKDASKSTPTEGNNSKSTTMEKASSRSTSFSKSSSLQTLKSSSASSSVGVKTKTPLQKVRFEQNSERSNSKQALGAQGESMRSSLSDGTSSELMRLRGIGDDFDSPRAQPAVSKLKMQLEDISPIERQKARPVSGNLDFRASSRIADDGSTSAKQRATLSDSEIVKLHRSLGAGTVTPLPRADQTPIENETSANASEPSRINSSLEHSQLPARQAVNGMDSSSATAIDLSNSQEKMQSSKIRSRQSSGKPNTSRSNLEKRRPNDANESDGKSASESRHYLPSQRDGSSTGLARVDSTDDSTPEEVESGIELGDPKRHESNRDVRGVYDIRDSTGPGSTNRKRLIAGKAPVTSKTNIRDPLDIYVSEDARSEFSAVSSRVLEHEARVLGRNRGTEHAAETEAKEIGMTSKNEATSFSSMSSESPVLSYVSGQDSKEISQSVDVVSDTMTSSSAASKDTSIAHGPVQLTDLEKKDVEDRKYARQNAEHRRFATDSMRIAATLESRVLLNSATTSKGSSPTNRNLHQLWEKFQRNFSPSIATGRGDVFEKIDVLHGLLNEQNDRSKFIHPGDISQESKRRRPYKAVHSEADLSNQRQLVDTRTKFAPRKPVSENRVAPSKQTESMGCPNCGKRTVATNCPTPVPFEKEGGSKVEQPLLLHIWTQTTPHKGRSFAEKGPNRGKSLKRHEGAMEDVEKVPVRLKPSTEGDKENDNKFMSSPANKQSMSPKDRISSTWNVVFDGDSRRLQRTKSSQKPPIHPISKVDLRQPVTAKKKKESVFTAWFQSTRSDTSSGTVVPLSDVPRLADTYKENKNVPKMHVEQLKAKETETVVRVGLQEAFQFAKSDFIQRSKERMEDVKNARLNALKKKHLKNLKERKLEEAVVKNIQKNVQPKAIEHLFNAKKRSIKKKEMLEQNKRMYDKLPEVVKRREDEQRKARYMKNRTLMKQYDQKLRTVLLKKQRI